MLGEKSFSDAGEIGKDFLISHMRNIFAVFS